MDQPKAREEQSLARRILIIEDEMLIALMLKDMITDAGLTVEAIARSLNSGIELAKTRRFDLAILDINLGGKDAYPIAEILQKRGTPFIFSTGYGEASMQSGFNHVPKIIKPFQQNLLFDAIEDAFNPDTTLSPKTDSMFAGR